MDPFPYGGIERHDLRRMRQLRDHHKYDLRPTSSSYDHRGRTLHPSTLSSTRLQHISQDTETDSITRGLDAMYVAKYETNRRDLEEYMRKHGPLSNDFSAHGGWKVKYDSKYDSHSRAEPREDSLTPGHSYSSSQSTDFEANPSFTSQCTFGVGDSVAAQYTDFEASPSMTSQITFDASPSVMSQYTSSNSGVGAISQLEMIVGAVPLKQVIEEIEQHDRTFRRKERHHLKRILAGRARDGDSLIYQAEERLYDEHKRAVRAIMQRVADSEAELGIRNRGSRREIVELRKTRKDPTSGLVTETCYFDDGDVQTQHWRERSNMPRRTKYDCRAYVREFASGEYDDYPDQKSTPMKNRPDKDDRMGWYRDGRKIESFSQFTARGESRSKYDNDSSLTGNLSEMSSSTIRGLYPADIGIKSLGHKVSDRARHGRDLAEAFGAGDTSTTSFSNYAGSRGSFNSDSTRFRHGYGATVAKDRSSKGLR